MSDMGNATVTNSTSEKPPVTMEGMAVAYGSLVLMAIVPVFLGSLRSVRFHESKKLCKEEAEDRMTSKRAAMFPVMASGILFGIYIVFKIFPKEWVNMLVTGYFYVVGVVALGHLLGSVISKFVPRSVPNLNYNLKFLEGDDLFIDYKFTTRDVITYTSCCIFGLWYLIKKHWIANNMFGLAFSISGVEMLLLNKVSTGVILLVGLFVYDIFWVFYTDVMVTVAKSFEAPVKLVFPQDIFENGLNATNFAMLGLGDIVIPGIFIALLLRFDHSLKRKKNVYFTAAMTAYIVGLLVTIMVMHHFKHAQPALLYLVPACLLAPLSIALVKGDVAAMFKYEDYPEHLTKSTEKANENNSSIDNPDSAAVKEVKAD